MSQRECWWKMRYRFGLLAAAVALTLAGTGCVRGRKAGCSKDTDCKGDRICVAGTCRHPHPDRRPDGGRAVSSHRASATKARGGAGAGGFAGSAPGATAGPGSALGSSGSPSGGGSPLGPGGPLGSLRGPDLQIKICRSGRCNTFGPGSGPGSLMQLMDLFMQMGMGGIGGMGSVPNDLQIQVCTKGRCVAIGKDFGKDPADVMRLMDLVMSLMGGMGVGGANPFFGMGGLGRPGRGRAGPSAPPPVGPVPRKGNGTGALVPGTVTYRSLDDLRKAGPSARGKVAELSDLSISSVTARRAVFLGGGGAVLIIVRIQDPTLARKLQTRTGKVTVRFQVDSVVSGSLIQGTLLSFR